MIRYSCPRCKAVHETTPQNAGAKLSCPSCGQRLQVPLPPVNKTVLAPLVPGAPKTALRTASVVEPKAPKPPPEPPLALPEPPERKVRWPWLLLPAAGVLAMSCLCCGGGMAVYHFYGVPGATHQQPSGDRFRLEETVRHMIEDQEHRTVKSVHLVKKSDNEYEGTITAADGTEGSIHVTRDGPKILATWWWNP